ncbi:MAG: FprA family A-type flavoprotein [Kiritimatiellia bacterium]
MNRRLIRDHVFAIGVNHWNRRLFDSLIPLPDGTSYNSYLIQGSEKIAVLDGVDPALTDEFFANLEGIDRIDYIVGHHVEQDHAGAIPEFLRRWPLATLLCSSKAKGMFADHLSIDESRIRVVEDGEKVSLGDKTLHFISTPWVHWPETMSTWLPEDKLLFSCDFFGSHLATTDLYATDECRVYESARRYYAEIMMPFRAQIRKNLEKIQALPVEAICPSHGPIYARPAFIIDAYRDWVSDACKNQCVIPYVSMHGSTQLMVNRLVESLTKQGVTAIPFDLAVVDIGKLAEALVDAATVVLGSCAVLVGPHPLIAHAAMLANALRPKTRYAGIIGSYGWGTKMVEHLVGSLGNLKVELFEPVLARGCPKQKDFEALDRLAEAIALKHKSL